MYNPRVVTCAWLAQSDSREGRTAATAGWLRTSAEGWLEVKWSGPSRILGGEMGGEGCLRRSCCSWVEIAMGLRWLSTAGSFLGSASLLLSRNGADPRQPCTQPLLFKCQIALTLFLHSFCLSNIWSFPLAVIDFFHKMIFISRYKLEREMKEKSVAVANSLTSGFQRGLNLFELKTSAVICSYLSKRAKFWNRRNSRLLRKNLLTIFCFSKAMDAHLWKKYLKKSHCGLLGPDRSRFGIRKWDKWKNLPCVWWTPPSFLMPSLSVSQTLHFFLHLLWRLWAISVPPAGLP